MSKSIILRRTLRFSTLDLANNDIPEELMLHSNQEQESMLLPNLPVMTVTELLKAASLSSSEEKERKRVSSTLWSHLETYSFVILSFKTHSLVGNVIHDLKNALDHDFFPRKTVRTNSCGGTTMNDEVDLGEESNRNRANLQSGYTYISERGVPMWKLGYEHCDAIREAFRVHGGSPDSQAWPSPSSSARRDWLRGMCLCRNITDAALNLTLNYKPKSRPGSGWNSWIQKNQKDDASDKAYFMKPQHSLPDRNGDYSVMYAMHYYNDMQSEQARREGIVTGSDNADLNVKEHVDPSLFVLEPFLADREGLQVKPSCASTDSNWITCDGPSSPIHSAIRNQDGNSAMVLFVGRAFAANSKTLSGRNVKPTLHRVIATRENNHEREERRCSSRRSIIYEQKYDEYFPPPALD